MDGGERCWYCGMAPVVMGYVHSFEQEAPVAVVLNWDGPAAADHEHALTPPTPQQLIDAGYRSWTAIVGDLA